MNARRRFRAYAIQAALVAVVLGVWDVTSMRGMVNPLIVPPALKVWDEFLTSATPSAPSIRCWPDSPPRG